MNVFNLLSDGELLFLFSRCFCSLNFYMVLLSTFPQLFITKEFLGFSFVLLLGTHPVIFRGYSWFCTGGKLEQKRCQSWRSQAGCPTCTLWSSKECFYITGISYTLTFTYLTFWKKKRERSLAILLIHRSS